MRDLSVMEIEMVSGAGWWADLWGSATEAVGAFFRDVGAQIRDAFQSWVNGTPNVTPQQQQIVLACMQANYQQIRLENTNGSFSLSFNTQSGSVTLGYTGSSSHIICNGAAVP